MDEFCGSSFWDSELSWNTEDSTAAPDLTPCFQNTVLVWVPCAFFWIFFILDLIYDFGSTNSKHSELNSNAETLHNQNPKKVRNRQSTSTRNSHHHSRSSGNNNGIPWSPFNLSKVVICVLLIISQLARLGNKLKLKFVNGYILHPVDTYSPVLSIATYALVLFSTVISVKKGIRSSVIQFTFWLLLSVCHSVKFRSAIVQTYQNQNTIVNNGFQISLGLELIILELIDYPLILGQFLLHCWADVRTSSDSRISSSSDTDATRSTKLPCPQHSVSALSRLLFSWFDSLAWKGHQKSLERNDLWELNPEDKTKEVVTLFNRISKQKLCTITKTRAPSASSSPPLHGVSSTVGIEIGIGILPVLVSAFGGKFFTGSALKLIPDLLAFASPQILNLLIAFVSSQADQWKGYFYAALLFLTALVSTLATAHYNHVMFASGMRVKSTLVGLLYRKSLAMSNYSKKDATTGEIVNLMSVDVQNVIMVIPYINLLWSSPLQISLSVYFLWDILGPSILAGVGVMILLIPINTLLGKVLHSLQVQQMGNKDERVKLISEILSGIKILKLYAWELSFQDEVMKIRKKEIQTLNRTAYLNAVSSFLWTCSPFMVAIATFGTYVLVDRNNVLDAQKVFVSLALLNVMTDPFTALPMVIGWAIQAGVSLGRISKFLNAEEIDTAAISHDENKANPIVIENGNFSWDCSRLIGRTNEAGERDGIVLQNINLKIKEGSLMAIVGPVGSGKSSLLSAILGELEKISGKVNTDGTISYVAQQAWIQNGTLRENILFGKPLNGRSYNKIIEACALGPDLDIFPGRDKIEIGEKGINLSGGQKQRVSMARAVYNNSDLYLFDDPLSAVDSHVGKHIFDKVLSSKGLLGRKTRVLVTNALHFLNQVDRIVVMKNGRISETGTYDELMEQKGEFADLITQYTQDAESYTDTDTASTVDISIASSTEEIASHSLDFQDTILNVENANESKAFSRSHTQEFREKPMGKESEKLIAEETMETQSVKWSIYLEYFRAVSWKRVVPAVLIYMLYQAFSIGSNVWLANWSDEPIINGTQGHRDLYLGVYAALGIAQSISFMVATSLICLAVIRSASIFHGNLLARILRAPMSFFDTTPSGRILNRFSKDVDVLDNTLSYMFRTWLGMMTNVLGILCIIAYNTPSIVLVIIPICVFYYFVQRFFVPTSRQLKRLESVTRSPIYSHFSGTISGLTTIRAFGVQDRFIAESETIVDENQACYYPSIVSNRWLAIRLEAAGSVIIFFAALFAVLSRDSLNPALVGLTISYALRITYYLGILVRSVCDIEANIVAVERLQEYVHIPQEAPWKSEWRKPPNSWPAYGSVQFKNYQTRYREGMDLVLKNVTCSIEPGEKIGVVGRTGAGKSSLTLALFRIIEGVNEGTITIDGEDIKKLGLHDIRSRLTIIPQDPVLFSGTLRFNLDPFRQYSDNAVWRALELSNLKAFVEGLQGELEFKVSEGGDNMSVGQKQLVCLTRALLRKSKILVLDEATAAVDLETDDLIQKTIRAEFKDSTVITIAHRLNTIMDSNRVMVIDNGSIREFDMPGKLLSNPASLFYRMADDAGLISLPDLE